MTNRHGESISALTWLHWPTFQRRAGWQGRGLQDLVAGSPGLPTHSDPSTGRPPRTQRNVRVWRPGPQEVLHADHSLALQPALLCGKEMAVVS